MIGRCVIVTMAEEYVTEEAKEQPHLMAAGPATGDELQYSFPLHPIHYDQFMAELFKMEEDFMFSVVVTDVREVLANVSNEDPP